MSEPTDTILSITVGGEQVPVALCANGKSYVFQPEKIHFIVAMQRMKNVAAAALSVGKGEEWGDKFLSSKKFRSYLTNKLQELTDKNSLNADWWYQFGKHSAMGFRSYFSGFCPHCNFSGNFSEQDAEMHRDDEMVLSFPCPACYRIMEMKEVREDFKPTREQIEAWKELGSRLIPKIERVQHQFSKEEFIFESGEAA